MHMIATAHGRPRDIYIVQGQACVAPHYAKTSNQHGERLCTRVLPPLLGEAVVACLPLLVPMHKFIVHQFGMDIDARPAVCCPCGGDENSVTGWLGEGLAQAGTVYKTKMYRHYHVAGARAIGHGRLEGLPLECYGAAAHGMANYQERSMAGHGSTSAAQAPGSALVCQGGRSQQTGN
jgi:hypothetical protein